MGFPTQIKHRPSRRKLGRGQSPTSLGVAVAVTGTGSVATLTFARPVVVSGTIPLAVTGLTIVSQSVTSPTVVAITLSGAVTGLDYTLDSGAANIATYQGGQVYGTSGTFP